MLSLNLDAMFEQFLIPFYPKIGELIMALSIRNNFKLQNIFDQTKELKLDNNYLEKWKEFLGEHNTSSNSNYW